MVYMAHVNTQIMPQVSYSVLRWTCTHTVRIVFSDYILIWDINTPRKCPKCYRLLYVVPMISRKNSWTTNFKHVPRHIGRIAAGNLAYRPQSCTSHTRFQLNPHSKHHHSANLALQYGQNSLTTLPASFLISEFARKQAAGHIVNTK